MASGEGPERTRRPPGFDGGFHADHTRRVFWYGWAADRLTPWIVPIIGTSFIGFGSMFVMVRDAQMVDPVSRRRMANGFPRCLCSCI